MTTQHPFSTCRAIRRASKGLVIAIMLSALLPTRLPAADETTIKPLVMQLIAAGETYDPQPLLDHGLAGLRFVLDQVFPETADVKKFHAEQVAALVEQLGDPSFERREQATAALRKFGFASLEVLRRSADHKDLEIRSRIRALIAEAERSQTPLSVNPGLQIYLDKLKDLDSQQELARRVTKALEARLDQSPRQEALRTSLQALARWPTDRVHNELLPLLKLDDPKPAIFALEQIGGRSGNEYVSALHMGAIASGNTELVRCAFRSLPSPVRDKTNLTKIKSVYANLFDNSTPYAELRKDSAFMYAMAYDAARYYRIPAARRWLIDKINGGSISAIGFLGAGEYHREPLDQELLTALEPHLKSADLQFRTVAIRTLGVYKGEAVQPALLRALADPEKQVWQTAAERLCDQHSFYEAGKSPIPKLLASALQKPANHAQRKRLEFLVKYLEQSDPGSWQWPD